MIAALLGRAWGWLAVLGTALAAIGAVYLKGRRDASTVARMSALERDREIHAVRDAADRAAARQPAAADQLRQRWSRD